MKFIRLVLCALGLASINSFATIMLDPTQVTVPQFDGGFVIGAFGGGYLQPSYTNGYNDFASFNTGTGASFASNVKNINLGYDWAWGASIGYIFPQTGNDINLQYVRFHTDDSKSFFGSALTVPYLTILSTDDFSVLLTSANDQIDFDLDQVDLTAGQYIFVGCRNLIHLAAGLRALDLDNKNVNNYGGFVIDGGTDEFIPATLYSNQKSDYQGIGPVAEIKDHYDLGSGFGLVGQLTSALLIGNIDDKWDLNATRTSGGESVAIDFNSTRRIVPNWTAKLGADYSYFFANAANSKISLEVGYLTSHYFNAVDHFTGITTVPFDPATSIHITRKTSDVALNGPYAALRVEF